jgi:hypothetical protein
MNYSIIGIKVRFVLNVFLVKLNDKITSNKQCVHSIQALSRHLISLNLSDPLITLR